MCSTTRLEFSPVYPIVNAETAGNPIALCEAFCASGVSIVQLRAKALAGRDFLDLARQCRNITRRTQVTFIINDRVDIARLSEADGVHLGQKDLSPADARTILGEKAIVGWSTSTIEEVQSCPGGVDYLGFGPIFETQSKNDANPTVGVERLGQAVRISPLPIVAIGGISVSNVEPVFRAGASSAAVIRDLETASDLGRRISAYRNVFLQVHAQVN